MIRYKLTEDITLEITDVGRDMDLALMHATGFGLSAWPTWLPEKANPVWWVKDRGLHNAEGVNIPLISTDDQMAKYFAAHLVSHNFAIDPGNYYVDAGIDGDYSFTITAHSGATTTATHVTFAGAVAWAALAFFAEGLADAPPPTVSSEWATLVQPERRYDTIGDYLDAMEAQGITPPAEPGTALAAAIEERRRKGNKVHVSYSEAARRVILNANMAETIRKATEEALNEPEQPDAIERLLSNPRYNTPSRPFSQRRLDMADAIATIRSTRAAILAALTAEIGDASTAERLTGVVMQALEDNGDE